MHIILLSGGSGKRLWPLSNDIRSKQFIRIFKSEEGSYESMLQRVYRRIREVSADTTVTIEASKAQVSAICNQLGENVGISVEPCRRDTFPAISLATAYLHDVQNVSDDEAVVVCPVDPYAGDDYFAALKNLGEQAAKGEANLVLMGIEFSGIFAYKLKYVLNKVRELTGFTNYYDLLAKYDTLTVISFDYAVVEKENKIQVMRFSGQWKDIGTWNTLAETLEDQSLGNAIMNETCDNVHIVNELDIPVLAMGLHDVVICAGAEGILV